MDFERISGYAPIKAMIVNRDEALKVVDQLSLDFEKESS